MGKALSLWTASILFGLLLWLLAQPSPLVAVEILPGTIPPSPAFEKSVQPVSVTAGSSVTFSLHFTHKPDLGVGNQVWITDVLPAGLEFVAGSAQSTLLPSPVFSGNQLMWQGNVPPGSQVSITYSTSVSPAITTPRVLTNTASWLGRELGLPGEGVVLTSSATITVMPQTLRIYAPLALNKWPPLPGPVNQLDNWNFDLGRVGWEEIGDKLIYSDSERPLPGGSEGYFAWLGGVPDSTHELKQSHQFSSEHYSLGLFFTYWITSQEPECTDEEKVELRIGSELLWSKHLCTANRTSPPGQPGWVRLDSELDVSRFAGKSVTVSFKSVLDAEENSNFYLDKVRICTNDPRLTVDRCP